MPAMRIADGSPTHRSVHFRRLEKPLPRISRRYSCTSGSPAAECA
jgi:hypothetical protein